MSSNKLVARLYVFSFDDKAYDGCNIFYCCRISKSSWEPLGQRVGVDRMPNWASALTLLFEFQVTFDAHREYLENIYRDYKNAEERSKALGTVSAISGIASDVQTMPSNEKVDQAAITEGKILCWGTAETRLLRTTGFSEYATRIRTRARTNHFQNSRLEIELELTTWLKHN